jgi:hypothetical protein
MPSLWSSYQDKKMRTSSKAYGIELCCYWELGEEPFGSLMGTHWEQKKTKKSQLAPPPTKEKTLDLVGACCITSSLAYSNFYS